MKQHCRLIADYHHVLAGTIGEIEENPPLTGLVTVAWPDGSETLMYRREVEILSDADKILTKIQAEPDQESIAWIREVFKNIP